MTPDEAKEERFRRAYATLEAQAGSWVIPIYGFNRDGLLQPAGSAILIRHGQREHYLVTAGHVFDQNRYSTLYTFGGSEQGLLELEGSEALTTQPGGLKRSADKLDLGVMKLGRDLVRQIRKTDAEFAPTTAFWRGELLKGAYAFMGYPMATNTVSYDISPPTVQRYFMSFRVTGAPDNRYASVGCSTATHFVAVFDHRRLFSELGLRVPAMEPHGISGGALIYHGSLDAVFYGHGAPRIVGIGIEYHESEYLMVATRSIVVLEVLRQLRERLGLTKP